MRKIVNIIGIVLAITLVIKIPEIIHSFKRYGARAKASDAKLILACAHENRHCIKPNQYSFQDVLLNCPEVKCFSERESRYYKTIYIKESVIVIKGKINTRVTNKKHDDIWVLTQDKQLINCLDGAGWDSDDKNPLCLNI
jgi:hypothetical protein